MRAISSKKPGDELHSLNDQTQSSLHGALSSLSGPALPDSTGRTGKKAPPKLNKSQRKRIKIAAFRWALSQTIPAHQKLVLVVLTGNSLRGKYPASVNRLAIDCGLDRDATVAALKKLHQSGTIDFIREDSPDGTRTTRLVVNQGGA
jgi:hypothetical protein